jgi:uncharacterized repeat protein (TIGR02543 family)/prepilin-type N-terminal cleavage/methylation domain-containing protein
LENSNMKKNKGFTLIELLAIIVILAIIAVITVPIILNIVENSKRGAAINSAYGFKDAINKKYVSSMMWGNGESINGTYSIQDGKIMGGPFSNEEIDVSGLKPTIGSLTFEDNKLKSGCLVIDGYEVRYINESFTSTGKGNCSDLVEDTSNNEPINYSISFNTNGGNNVSNQTVELGYQAVEPPIPTKEGYTFGGWYLDEECTQLYDFTNPITGEITLYAKWIENAKPTYTVTFNSNGGSSVSNQTIEEGDKATQPNNPTKEGYTFNGWYSDSGLTQSFDFNTTINSNIDLFAKWTESITYYTVSFYSNGGSNVSSQSIASGQTATRPTNPTKSGYTFGGWYTNSSLTNAFSFSTPITNDTNLYAKWTVNYTVTFNSNGGSSVSSQSVASGQKATRPTNPTKSGYSFSGWYSDSGLTTEYNFNNAVTSNKTLYAKWVKALEIGDPITFYVNSYSLSTTYGTTWADFLGTGNVNINYGYIYLDGYQVAYHENSTSKNYYVTSYYSSPTSYNICMKGQRIDSNYHYIIGGEIE